jgi:DNA-binding transcriptional MerR regulator
LFSAQRRREAHLSKTEDAFRTISEVASELDVPKHVLRFWEGRFPQIKPMKRGGGRRYYRPEDLSLLRGIHRLLHGEGYTIKGVQKILREQGVDTVKQMGTEVRPTATAAEPAGASKRGRRGKPAKTDAAPASNAKGAAMAPRELRPLIEGAVAELEVCRSILLGRAIETSARRRPGKARRAARP